MLGVVGQGAASFVLCLFFLCCNLVDDDSREPVLLSSIVGLLGLCLGFGLCSALKLWLSVPGSAAELLRLPLFFIVVAIFHLAEFTFAVAFHPNQVEFRAFLLTPVPAAGYSIAMVSAIAEFWIFEAVLGRRWLPEAARCGLLVVGFALSFGGWSFRTLALFTAKSNFTHMVAVRKKESHQLVQHGVYRFCRHPAYAGWFLWSVASQLVLGNVFCLAAYAFVSWKFFADRIPHEEAMLLRFFGDEYLDYASRVPCGLPWISRLP